MSKEVSVMPILMSSSLIHFLCPEDRGPKPVQFDWVLGSTLRPALSACSLIFKSRGNIPRITSRPCDGTFSLVGIIVSAMRRFRLVSLFLILVVWQHLDQTILAQVSFGTTMALYAQIRALGCGPYILPINSLSFFHPFFRLSFYFSVF